MFWKFALCVKAQDKDGDCFANIAKNIPAVSDAKLKESILGGPQIRSLFNDDECVTKMTEYKKALWLSIEKVSQNCLGNQIHDDYKNIVDEMLQNFKNLGCLMSMELHFLHSHRDYFSENLGNESEVQGERSH